MRVPTRGHCGEYRCLLLLTAYHRRLPLPTTLVRSQLPRFVARLVRIVGMGRLIQWEASYSVRDDAPQPQLTWQSLSGFENAGVATFSPVGDGSRCRTVVNMTYSVPLTLKPLEQSPWIKRFMASTMQGAMESFQLALEADGRLGSGD